ncbi:MAG: flagellin FliC [Gammaproteobacteria bacterium]|nr:flagellin FliC [Gammaproteobacteria bacterium]
MAMVINTNIGSENAIRLLDKSGRSQSTSMERLTSGQRINGAGDDAAGLAIVTGMTAQIRGTDMAIRNANDGMGLLQTMDGASEEVVNMLQRMRELSIQSLNGTYSNENRNQMNAEVQQLRKEIDRVAGTTKFNEIPLMATLGTKGSYLSTAPVSLKLQVGWEVAGLSATNKITVSIANFWTGVSGNTGVFGQATITAANGSKAVVNSAFSKITISTATNASQAVMKIDSALSRISTERAKWGALQNRLEYTVSNLQNVNENMQAARSRIQDTDYARESANLARTQVLQQAGMSMLTQANQMSQNVLSLLK